LNGKAKSAQAKNIRERIGAILAGCLFVAVGSCSKAGANTGPGKTGTAATGQSACDRKLLTADDVGGILSDPVVGTKDLKGDPQTCYFLTKTSESAGGPELMITLRPGLGRATIETYTSGRMKEYATSTPLPGVGDGAVWLPDLHEVDAQKNDVLCIVQPHGLRKELARGPVEVLQKRLGGLCTTIFQRYQP